METIIIPKLFKGVDMILYKQSYEFVISNGGSVAEAHRAGLKKVQSRKKLSTQLKKENFTY